MNKDKLLHSLFFLLFINTTTIFASIEATPVLDICIIEADRQSGIIGTSSDSEVEDLSDNYFSIELPNGIDLSSAGIQLEYELYGLSDGTQTTKSINGHIATGGQVIQVSTQWRTVSETLNPRLLKEGTNSIFFNRRENVSYQYKVRNLKVRVLSKNDSNSLLNSIQVNGYKNQTTITGFQHNPNFKKVRINEQLFSIENGVIDVLLSTKTNKKDLRIYWVDENGNETSENFPIQTQKETPSFIFSQKESSKTVILSLQQNTIEEFEALSFLDISEDASLNKLEVTGLAFKDFHMLDASVSLVTNGKFDAYRLKNLKVAALSDDLKISLRYDVDKIPAGYSAKDVRIFSFNKVEKEWKQLRVDSLDIENQMVFSKFSGDTDYVNGVIKVPEMPEAASFMPTSITDMEYANPTAGIVQIAPPSPNNMGALTTSFPIKLPAGRNGMMPSLAVSYNSQGGNGWMGMGWDMQLPAITLDTRWGAPRFDTTNETELYSLAGQSLVVKVGDEYTSPHRYVNPDDDSPLRRNQVDGFYLRKEGSYAKIERHGSNPSNYFWEVTDKLGNKSFYGGETMVEDNTVIKDNSNPRNITHWALYKTVDTYGNYVEYTYEKNENVITNGIATQSFYPASIQYTLQGETNPNFYQVDFSRVDPDNGGYNRQDISLSSRSGALMATTELLYEIKISFMDGTLLPIRTYHFDYEEKQFNKTQLVSISELDSNDDPFYTHAIEYYDDDINSGIINSSSVDWTGSGETELVGSVIHSTYLDEATGLTKGSVLHASSSKGWNASLRAGIGFGINTLSVTGTVGASFSYDHNKETTQINFIDINGDGLPDKVYKYNNNSIKYMPNLGTNDQDSNGTFGNPLDIEGASSLDVTKSRTYGFGLDLNATKEDLYGFSVGASLSLTRMDTGSYFTDFNGDGLPDILVGNRIKFNSLTNGNPNQTIDFVSTTTDTENPIISGSIAASREELDLESMDELHAQYAQFDHVTTWRAPFTGEISITGSATLATLNDCDVASDENQEGNKIRLTIETATADQLADGTGIADSSIFQEDLDIEGQIANFSISTLSINKGDILFFRTHNYKYGCGGEIAWNPTINYIDIGAGNALSDNLDENGKNYWTYNPADDFIINNGGSWVSSPGTDTVVINPNFNDNEFFDYQFSDTVNFIIRKSTTTIITNGDEQVSETDEEDWVHSYVPEALPGATNIIDDGMPTGFNLTPLGDENTTKRYSYSFLIESTSNVQWDKIIWQPQITQDDVLIYPPINVKTYDLKRNNRKYTIRTDLSSFPSFTVNQNNDGTDDGNLEVMQLSHNVFTRNYNPLLNQMEDNGPPIKINWVSKKTVDGLTTLMNTASFYLFKDCTGPCQAVFRDGPEISDTVLNIENSHSYYQFNLSKTEANALKAENAIISSTINVNNKLLLDYGIINAFIKTIPEATDETYNKSFLYPVFSQQTSVFGTTHRGWSQFLYNGGIDYSIAEADGVIGGVEYDAGDIVPDISTSFDGAIAMDVFVINENEIPTNEEFEEPVIPETPTEVDIVRYANFIQDNNARNYTNPGIFTFEDETNEAKAITYGLNEDGILTSSVGRFGEYNLFDVYISDDELTGENTSGIFVGIKQRAKSSGIGFSGSITIGDVDPEDSGNTIGYNGSYSKTLSSKTLSQYVDLNGDRYPDLITKKNIQYTDMSGGLAESENNDFTTGSKQTNSTEGVTLAGKFPNATNSDNNRNTLTNVSAGLNVSHGKVEAIRQWIDINGDGLADKVWLENQDVKVNLNLGYAFTSNTIDWGSFNENLVSSHRTGSSISGSTNGGIGGLILNGGDTPLESSDDITASFAFGLGFGESEAKGEVIFTDVNADGLVDILFRGNVGNIYYHLNNGSNFDATPLPFIAPNNNEDLKNIARDYSISSNLFGTATVGFTLLKLKFVVTATAGLNAGFNEKQVAIRDINGDGYPDLIVKGENNGNLKVYLNTLDKIHKLHTVKSALGSNWKADYTRVGNSFNMPQSQLVYTRLETHDGFSDDSGLAPDNTITTINYYNPKHDRREREFLGFADVTINQLDPENTGNVYRRQNKNYHTDNIYLKGALKEQTISDGDNIPLSKSENLYNIMDPDAPQTNLNPPNNYLQSGINNTLLDYSRLFVAPVKKISKQYEGPDLFLDTEEQFKTYDRFGNLTEYRNLGDTHTDVSGQDGITTYMRYFGESQFSGLDNGTGFIESMRVNSSSGGTLYRQRDVKYNAHGSITDVSIKLNNTQESSVLLEYDSYGNLEKSTLDNGFFTELEFDSKVNTYPISVTNSWGYESAVQYNYLFGIPVLTTDINDQQMRTRIDDRGRVVEITAPKEMPNNWTIQMNYKGDMEDPTPFTGDNFMIDAVGDFNAGDALTVETEAKHYALTRHNINGDENNQLLTVSLVDGTGKQLQSKKTLAHNVTPGLTTVSWLVSGKAVQDGFGRITEQHLPTLEEGYPSNATVPVTAFNYYTGTNDPFPLFIQYDSKDRPISIKQPEESQPATTEFSIVDGYFVAKATNEEGQTMEVKTDVKGRKRQTIQNDELTTTFHYNAIGEKIKVRNQLGYDTFYTYDFAGRRIEEKHPDRGITSYAYDTSNNLISKNTSNLLEIGQSAIEYFYDFNRLTNIVYPINPANNVSLYYGEVDNTEAENANALGRLFIKEDATGVQGFSYDEMGNINKHLKGISVPGKHTFWYQTDYEYDSFNRIKNIVYPDQESVGYFYNVGGTLSHITAVLNREGNRIVTGIDYTQYGERSEIIYGNGTKIKYEYDTRRRIASLENSFSDFSDFNNKNLYKYDRISNIKSIVSDDQNSPLPGLNQLGGPVSHTYTYDDYNRLVGASGRYVGPNDFTEPYLAQEYTLDMEYDLGHNILSKTQTHYQGEMDGANGVMTTPEMRPATHYQLEYSGYATGGNVLQSNDGSFGYVQPHAPREILERPDSSLEDETDPRFKKKLIEYDASGNMLSIKQVIAPEPSPSPIDGVIDPSEITLQEYIWDEENRLRAVNLNPEERTPHPLAVYTYDSDGQRTIKHVPGRLDVKSNASAVSSNEREEVLLYPSGLVTSKAFGENSEDYGKKGLTSYTKHYYIGSQRVHSAIGTAKYLGLFPVSEEGKYPNIRSLANAKVGEAATALINTYNQMEQTIALPSPIVESNVGTFDHDSKKYDSYWYHADLVGSSSYISDRNGNVTQHMEYLPFGELLVDEHQNSYNTPYKFNGKELDEETGNYYYGARYYNPKWSIWLGVDPLAEQMPEWSSYNYVFSNPIKYKDPTGMAPEVIGDDSGSTVGCMDCANCPEYCKEWGYGIYGDKKIGEGEHLDINTGESVPGTRVHMTPVLIYQDKNPDSNNYLYQSVRFASYSYQRDLKERQIWDSFIKGRSDMGLDVLKIIGAGVSLIGLAEAAPFLYANATFSAQGVRSVGQGLQAFTEEMFINDADIGKVNWIGVGISTFTPGDRAAKTLTNDILSSTVGFSFKGGLEFNKYAPLDFGLGQLGGKFEDKIKSFVPQGWNQGSFRAFSEYIFPSTYNIITSKVSNEIKE